MRGTRVRLRRAARRRSAGLAPVTLRYFGVDGEMSAADLSTGGRLIQIGIAAHSAADGEPAQRPQVFCALLDPGEMAWDPRAAAVHGLDEEEVRAAGPAAQIDEQAVAWLAGHGIGEPRRGIAVGFNVGAFDLPHLAAVLPRTAGLFSRRSVDLNAVCFTLEGREHHGTVPSWAGWRRMSSTYAQRVIAAEGVDAALHDAGYDALVAVHAWRFLRAAAHGQPLAVPNVAVAGLGRDTQIAAGRLLSRLGPQAAAEASGFSTTALSGWASGGRVRDRAVLERITAVLAGLEP